MTGSRPNHTRHSVLYQAALPALLVLMGWMIFLPACVHEPMDPIDPDPMDTTQNPVDTLDPDPMGDPCLPDVVYFEKDVLPILRSNCAKSGCHDAITQEKDIILDSYANVMKSGEVRPYDLNKSDLYEVIRENDPDKRMPPPPNQPLTTDQIDIIKRWIQQGAKNLTCDETAGICDTTAVSFAAFVAPVLQTHCIGCHSGGAPSGGILLNSHAAVQTVALNGRLAGAITHAPGYQPMPRGSARLADCTIDKIKAWIHHGALNN